MEMAGDADCLISLAESVFKVLRLVVRIAFRGEISRKKGDEEGGGQEWAGRRRKWELGRSSSCCVDRRASKCLVLAWLVSCAPLILECES